MKDKLTAEEIEREINYIQETGANSIRYYELFEKFAERYHRAKLAESDLVSRKELLEWLESKKQLTSATDKELMWKAAKNGAYNTIISHLTQPKENENPNDVK